ncbi:MAG: AAA family ATPase [Planctomycetia bacterium]|nr:AAA family ATPase [Planctomycetia bacterium]
MPSPSSVPVVAPSFAPASAASARTPFAGVRCADLTSEPVSWVWEPYLARGKLAVLDGDPGTGKSFFTIDLACRITTGAPMPGSKLNTKPANVLLLNAEDDARDTIRPRVLAAGGDPARVRLFAAPGIGLERIPTFPMDFSALEAAIYETEAALVVIDPMTAFFPADMGAFNPSICIALLPFSALAASTGACILLVRHLRKSGGASAIYRGVGSIGIMGAVRTGLMLARHPDDLELRVLTLSKTNIGPPAPSLGFRLCRKEPTGETIVNWTGPVDMTADDLFGADVPLRAGQRSRERAVEWLKKFLEDGPRRATEVHEGATAAGIAERTLRRVKAIVGVKSEAVKLDGKLEWRWRLPKTFDAEERAKLKDIDRYLKLKRDEGRLETDRRIAELQAQTAIEIAHIQKGAGPPITSPVPSASLLHPVRSVVSPTRKPPATKPPVPADPDAPPG